MYLNKNYLKNPCSQLPIPLWKYNTKAMDKSYKIVNSQNFQKNDYQEYSDHLTYRMFHDLIHLKTGTIDTHYFIKTYVSGDENDLYEILKCCYPDQFDGIEKVLDLLKEETFMPHLCFFLYNYKYYRVEKVSSQDFSNKKTKKYLPVGVIVGNFDNNVKEATIEYLAIINDYRGKNLGTYLIREELVRMSNYADFVTCVVDEKDADVVLPFLKNVGFNIGETWHHLKLNK